MNATTTPFTTADLMQSIRYPFASFDIHFKTESAADYIESWLAKAPPIPARLLSATPVLGRRTTISEALREMENLLDRLTEPELPDEVKFRNWLELAPFENENEFTTLAKDLLSGSEVCDSEYLRSPV